MTNFNYKVSYKCKNQEDSDLALKELVKLGYNQDGVIYKNYDIEHSYITTGWNHNNGVGFSSTQVYETDTNYHCDSINLFLALAAMRNSEEFFIGEYVYTDNTSHLDDYRRDTDSKIFKIEEVSNQYSSTDNIHITWLRPTKDESTGIREYLCRKATVEELKNHFQVKVKEEVKEVTIKEDNKVNTKEIAVKGTKSLVKAFGEELDNLGWKCVRDIESAKVIKEVYYIITYEDNTYGFYTHDGSNTTYSLPAQWDSALAEASKKTEKELVLEAGKWYKVNKDSRDYDAIVCFQGIDGEAYGVNHANEWSEWYGDKILWTNKLNSISLAEESDIETALIIGAKSKGFKEGVKFKDAESGTVSTVGRDIDTATYYKRGVLQCGNTIYHNGKWAEIVSSTPTIEINGYKAKFNTDSVSFGCQTISLDVIKEIARLQQVVGVDLTAQASNIESIVEYYDSKK